MPAQDAPIVSAHSSCRLSVEKLRSNVGVLKSLLAEGSAMGVVVKSNAYGHGLKLVSASIRDQADILIVFSIAEALAVRHATGAGRILVAGPLSPRPADVIEALEQEIELTIANPSWMPPVLDAAEASGRLARLHLKLDTGTNRQGMNRSTLLDLASELQKDGRVNIRALSTHFADIEDTLDHSFAQKQFEEFSQCAEELDALLGEAVEKHCANSAATLLWSETHGSFVRAGLAAYGLWPSRETFLALRMKDEKVAPPNLEPIMEWVSEITEVRQLEAGDFVGYGRSFRCTGNTRIAIVPIGYADGISRSLSNKGHVLVEGVRAPIRGRVCMNMTMIDVTNIPGATMGSEVVLLGRRGQEDISAELFGDWMGSINYEACTSIGAHIPRVAVDVPADLRDLFAALEIEVSE